MSHSLFFPVELSHTRAAQTLVELLCALSITAAMLAGAVTGVVALQKSMAGSSQYATGFNDGSRLVDYVSRDLRSAIRVSRISSGTASAFKTGFFPITDTDQLVVLVPGYFQSNVPNNTSGSSYKTPVYSRSNLDSSSGVTFFPYTSVVAVIGTLRVPTYPGELEIRYLKK